MLRRKHVDEAGSIYHALNRGNARQTIFHKDEDYEAFLRVLGEGLERYPVELFSSSLMPHHWHMVLRPSEGGLMGRMLRWVTAKHTQRYHAHDHAAGEGHLYQSRFKSFPIADDDQFLVDSSNAELDRTWESVAQRARIASVTRERRARPTFWRSGPDDRSCPVDMFWRYASSSRSPKKAAGMTEKTPVPFF